MKELTIKNYKGINVTDSREVAEMIGKEHKNLIRDIRNYIEVLQGSKLSSENFFIESEYFNSRNQKQPCYLLTKQGCEMVANKMTGEKGILFTAEYVQAFNKMEEHIGLSGSTDLLLQFLQQLPQEQIQLLIKELQHKLLPSKPVKDTLYDFLADNLESLSLTFEDYVEVNYEIFSTYFTNRGYNVSDVLKKLCELDLIKSDAFGFCVKYNNITIKMKPSLKFYED